MSYKSDLQQSNADLQAILYAVDFESANNTKRGKQK